MTNSSETVAKILLKIKAISLNPKEPFRYDSGILSPVYIDNRLLISYPEERKIIRDLYIESMNSTGQQFDLISATDHGKKNRVEGVVKKRAKTAVIEDLISTGESSIETAKAVIGTGGEVSYIFAIITYGMKKADENFKANNLKLITLTTFADVLEIAEKSGQISGKEKEIILDWTKDPESWGKKNGF